MRAPRDAGSILPLTLLSVVLVLLLIAAAATSSSAFLAQRDLQAWCDAATLAAVDNSTLSTLYTADGGLSMLSVVVVQAELERYSNETQDTHTDTRPSVQDDRLTVVCTRKVGVPFGRLFGISDGLSREAVSSARVHWSA